MRARGPGSPAPPLTPASGSIPHTRPRRLCPGLWAAVGRMLVREGREEGRKARCEALRGRGAGRQAQEVNPWPAVWPATSPRAWRRFSLKLGSQLLPPRHPQGPWGQPAAHTPLSGSRPCPVGMGEAPAVSRPWEAGLQAHGDQQAAALGARGSRHGRAPQRGRGTGLCGQSRLLPPALGPGGGGP